MIRVRGNGYPTVEFRGSGESLLFHCSYCASYRWRDASEDIKKQKVLLLCLRNLKTWRMTELKHE